MAAPAHRGRSSLVDNNHPKNPAKLLAVNHQPHHLLGVLQTILAPQTVTILAGEPKSGKSALLTAFVYAHSFLNERLPQGPAVWFSGDEYPRERQWLLQTIARKRKVVEVDGVPNLTARHFPAFIRDVGTPRIIVIDSLWALAALQPKSMRYPLPESLHQLHQVAVQTGAAVIAIHVPAKTDPDRMFERLAVNVCAFHSDYGHLGRQITLSLKRQGRIIADPLVIHSPALGRYEFGRDLRHLILTILSRASHSVVELAAHLNLPSRALHHPVRRLIAEGKLIVIGKQGKSDILARPELFALQTAIPTQKSP